MIKDKRKSKRQRIRYTAWVKLGPGQLHGCVLSNVSDSGACLGVQDATAFPDRFSLLLSNSGSAHRDCRVIWRRARELGVEFNRPCAATASPMSATDDNADILPEAEAEPKGIERE